MLRTRLYLGLLPLLLLIIATGAYAIYRGRDLAGSISRDVVNNYAAVVASQKMRAAATLMNSALRSVLVADADRRLFEDKRSEFMRELTTQSTLSRGSARAEIVNQIDTEFRRFVQRGERQLRGSGGAASQTHEEKIRDILENGTAVGSSRVDLQACKLEYSIVSPK